MELFRFSSVRVGSGVGKHLVIMLSQFNWNFNCLLELSLAIFLTQLSKYLGISNIYTPMLVDRVLWIRNTKHFIVNSVSRSSLCLSSFFFLDCIHIFFSSCPSHYVIIWISYQMIVFEVSFTDLVFRSKVSFTPLVKAALHFCWIQIENIFSYSTHSAPN